MKRSFVFLALFGLLALSPVLQAKVPEELKPYIEKVHADQLAIRDASKSHDKAAMAAAQKQMKADVKALREKQRQLAQSRKK